MRRVDDDHFLKRSTAADDSERHSDFFIQFTQLSDNNMSANQTTGDGETTPVSAKKTSMSKPQLQAELEIQAAQTATLQRELAAMRAQQAGTPQQQGGNGATTTVVPTYLQVASSSQHPPTPFDLSQSSQQSYRSNNDDLIEARVKAELLERQLQAMREQAAQATTVLQNLPTLRNKAKRERDPDRDHRVQIHDHQHDQVEKERVREERNRDRDHAVDQETRRTHEE